MINYCTPIPDPKQNDFEKNEYATRCTRSIGLGIKSCREKKEYHSDDIFVVLILLIVSTVYIVLIVLIGRGAPSIRRYFH